MQGLLIHAYSITNWDKLRCHKLLNIEVHQSESLKLFKNEAEPKENSLNSVVTLGIRFYVISFQVHSIWHTYISLQA